MTRRKLWIAAAIFWAAILMFVSVIPGADLPSVKIWEADKLFHALFYAILMLLSFAAWKPRFRSNHILSIAVLCILYGFLIELIQLWLPTRSFDMLDEMANATGTVLAALALYIISRKPARA